jgi:hypothetical protein
VDDVSQAGRDASLCAHRDCYGSEDLLSHVVTSELDVVLVGVPIFPMTLLVALRARRVMARELWVALLNDLLVKKVKYVWGSDPVGLDLEALPPRSIDETGNR